MILLFLILAVIAVIVFANMTLEVIGAALGIIIVLIFWLIKRRRSR